VFTLPAKPVDLADFSQWRRFTFGATWRRPYGKGSHVGGLGRECSGPPKEPTK
jgi:formylglycine-generating enzyme